MLVRRTRFLRCLLLRDLISELCVSRWVVLQELFLQDHGAVFFPIWHRFNLQDIFNPLFNPFVVYMVRNVPSCALSQCCERSSPPFPRPAG